MYSVGDKVVISQENDNEGYDDFRGQPLIITHVSYSVEDHPGYDESMDGMGLYDLKTESGIDVPFSLYEYELD